MNSKAIIWGLLERKLLLIGLSALLLLASCASYRQQSAQYYQSLEQADYDQAEKALGKNRLLKKKRNRLLYLLEKGKLAHLKGQWEESNRHFNEADGMMESERNSLGDIAMSNLLNPMMKTYRAEDFEKYLVHYYKAINYLQLNNREEALVEARRITLRNYALVDKAGQRDRYDQDGFALSLQGMIYEAAGDWNNAFIAYRNAANLYLENKGSHYGTSLPTQLKKDVLRMAHRNGFIDELQRYERLWNMGYDPGQAPEGGELLLFWESGSAPVKVQEDIMFSLVKGAGGSFFFTDSRGLYNVPFDMNGNYRQSNLSLTDLRTFRVALPRYESQPAPYSHGLVQLNQQSIVFEKAEDIETLAFATLKERMLKELSSTLTRMAIKKLAEAAVRNAGDNKSDKNMTEEEKKKEKKKENQREALALGLQIFNFATEKADTRNWQSLPNTIHYARIPLQKGKNQLQVKLQGHRTDTFTLEVEGRGGLIFQNFTR